MSALLNKTIVSLIILESLCFGNSCLARDIESGSYSHFFRRNVVVHKDDNFKKVFGADNTRFIIIEDLDLASYPRLEIGKNSVLDFRGGSINNGSLVGNRCRIEGSLKFSNVNFTHSFSIVDISDDMIDEKSQNNLDGLLSLLSPDYFQTLVLNGNYEVSTRKSTLPLVSNTRVVINGTICAKGNINRYAIIHIANCNNVTITGKGTIVGDADTNQANTGANGHGVEIYRSHNVVVEDITVSKCWGDGIYFDGDPSGRYASSDIVVRNTKLDLNRRQGISVILANNVLIEKNRITNTGRINGSDPQSAIDIEPNYQDQSLKDIVIKDNIIDNNVINGILCTGAGHTYNLTISNNHTSSGEAIYLRINSHEDCWVENQRINWLETVYFNSIHFKECDIDLTSKLTTPANRSTGVNYTDYSFGKYSPDGIVTFEKCSIRFPCSASHQFKVYQDCNYIVFNKCNMLGQNFSLVNAELEECNVNMSIYIDNNLHKNVTDITHITNNKVRIHNCFINGPESELSHIFVKTIETDTEMLVLDIVDNRFGDDYHLNPIMFDSSFLERINGTDRLNLRFKNNVFNKEFGSPVRIEAITRKSNWSTKSK